MDDGQDGLLTRRRLLAAGAATAASVVLLDTNAAAKSYLAEAKTPAPAPRQARTGYRRSRFAPHVGTPVKLRPPGGDAVRGTLVAVEDVPFVSSLAGNPDAYTLRFRVPAAAPLPEGVVGVRHKQFGTLHLYVTPAAGDGPTRDYLAAINRHIPRAVRRTARRGPSRGTLTG